jgi:hypothetical protein
MADISLAVGGVTFTFAEGEVKKISSKINTQVEAMAISGAGPATAYLYDYEGSVKTITITGVLFSTGTSRISGYSIDTIIEQKQWLESLANGIQSAITFTSNYESLSISQSAGATPPYQGAFATTKVFVQDMSFDEFEGNVEELPFSMTFIVGQA